LLNKDVQILLEGFYGVRVVDLRQTGPNAAYLMYVGMAGEGELPGRKAGGVRGLVSQTRERVGSGSSGSSERRSLFSRKGREGNGKLTAGVGGGGAVESLRRNMGGDKR
jgi:hypothetical protein